MLCYFITMMLQANGVYRLHSGESNQWLITQLDGSEVQHAFTLLHNFIQTVWRMHQLLKIPCPSRESVKFKSQILKILGLRELFYILQDGYILAF